MRLAPFLTVYSEPAMAILSSLEIVLAGTVEDINAAIKLVNTDPADFGLGPTVRLPLLPVVPASARGIYYQSGVEAYTLVSRTQAGGYDFPSSTCEALIQVDNLMAIALAFSSKPEQP